MMQHGWQGIALRAFKGKDFTCEVTGSTQITPTFRRVHLLSPDLLHALKPHPTMWARFWFLNDGKPHQRAYTILNPNISDGGFDIDVHLHHGVAARWISNAKPGEMLDVTLQGTSFTAPPSDATHMYLVGDAASIPAMRTILEALPDLPATLWLEQQDDSETDIPLALRDGDSVETVQRGDGTALVATVRQGLERNRSSQNGANDWFWLGCEASANRVLSTYLRKELSIPRQNISAMAYWQAT